MAHNYRLISITRGSVNADTSDNLDESGPYFLHLGCVQREKAGAAPKAPDNFWHRLTVRLSRHPPDEPLCGYLRQGTRMAQHHRHRFTWRHGFSFYTGHDRFAGAQDRVCQPRVSSSKLDNLHLLAGRIFQRSNIRHDSHEGMRDKKIPHPS